jgi:hypothetical protein
MSFHSLSFFCRFNVIETISLSSSDVELVDTGSVCVLISVVTGPSGGLLVFMIFIW